MQIDGQQSQQGFAGLSGMVSNIEQDLAWAKSRAPDGASDNGAPAFTKLPHGRRRFKQPVTSTFEMPAKGWLLGGLVLVIFLGAVFADKPRTPPAYVPQTTDTQPRVPIDQEADALNIEEQPPLGNKGNRLSRTQLRYCKYEEQRLKWAKGLIEADDAFMHQQFNDKAEDFRSRCVGTEFLKRDGTAVDAEVAQRGGEFDQSAQQTVRFWRAQKSLHPHPAQKTERGQ